MSRFGCRLEWLRNHTELLDSPYYTIRKAMIDEDIAKDSEFILDLGIPTLVSMIKHEIEQRRQSRGNQHTSR